MSTDVTGLRELVRRAKLRRKQLFLEEQDFRSQLRESEETLNILKQQANDSALDYTLKYSSPLEENTFSFDFILANRKLEIRLLNEDIKSFVPTLEAVATSWEAILNKIQSSSESLSPARSLTVSDIPVNFRNDIIHNIRLLTERKENILSEILDDLDERKRDKFALVDEIGTTKQLISVAIANLKNIDMAARVARVALEKENGKVDSLCKILRDLHSDIGHCHQGKGWKADAFLSISGSLDGSIDVGTVPALLSSYLPYPHLLNISSETIDKSLASIAVYMSDSKLATLNYDEFAMLCDRIVKGRH